MTAAIVALALLAGSLGVALALSVRSDKASTKALAAETTKHGETKLKLSQREYELTKERETVADLTKKNETLAKELADALAELSLGRGLAPGDTRGRVQRLAAEAATTGSPLPPIVSVELSDSKPAATGETIAAAVRNLHPIDVLK